jgi:hypothetical protein
MEQLQLPVMAAQVFCYLLGQAIQAQELAVITQAVAVVVLMFQHSHLAALVAVAQVVRNKLHH